MRLPRLSTRRSMVLVMVVGIGLAGRIQVARWQESRGTYELPAEQYAHLEPQFRQYADRTRDEWLRTAEKKTSGTSTAPWG